MTRMLIVAIGVAVWALLALRLSGAGPVGAGVQYAVIQTYPNPTPAANEEFGSALAWLPASNQLVVGARGDQLGVGQPVGAAYLLDANTGAIVHTFQKPAPVSGDYFGFSVAAAITNVVIGAPNDELSGTLNLPNSAGVAYLFDSVSGNLVYTYPHPAPAANDLFGQSVAIISDTLVVGAPQFDAPSNGNSGRVYLCGLLTGSCPAFVSNPSPGTPAGADNFGLALAATAGGFAVGAPYDGSHGTVYVYNYDSITATLTAVISETIVSTGDEFGRALAGVGNKLLIGAPADDTGANNAGVAYLYDLNGNLLHTFTNPVPHENDRFGSAVAGDANLIVIGASNDDAGGTDAGAVHLFDANSYAFIQTVQKPTPVTLEQFGFSLAAMGGDFAVGALRDSTTATEAGAAYRVGVFVFAGANVYLPLVNRP
jgi:hypothetical protein